MKIAVITDVHANLPALWAVLAATRQERCDLIVHTGDAIGIGPFPAECLELLLETPHMICLMGNHDAWLVDGLPKADLILEKGPDHAGERVWLRK